MKVKPHANLWENEIDYKKILIAYIKVVVDAEGVTFIGEGLKEYGLTDEELKVIRELANQI